MDGAPLTSAIPSPLQLRDTVQGASSILPLMVTVSADKHYPTVDAIIEATATYYKIDVKRIIIVLSYNAFR